MEAIVPPVSRNRWEKPLLLVAVAILLLGFFRNYSNPLFDRHSFRQTQTATVIESLARGEGMAEAKLYVFGPPWSMPVEFPLYQKIVSYPVRAGMSVEHAARLVSLLGFIGCLVVMRSFLRAIEFPQHDAVLAVIAVFPTYQMWSRTCLIESTALFLALLSLRLYWGLLHESFTWRRLTLLVVVSCLAALQKLNAYLVVTTFVALYLVATGRYRERRTLWPVLLVLAANGLAMAAWGAASEGARVGNLLAAQLTGPKHLLMLIGTVADRLSPRNFAMLVARSLLCAAFLPVILIAGFQTKAWRTLPGRVVVLLAAAVAVLYAIFYKVYSVHDYYHFSTNLYLLAGMLFLAVRWIPARRRAVFFIGLVVACAGANEVAYQRRLELTGETHREPYGLVKKALEGIKDPDAIVLVLGDDWSSAVNYTSGRKTLAMPTWFMERFLADPAGTLKQCNVPKIAAVVVMRDQYEVREAWMRRLQGIVTPGQVFDFPQADVWVARSAL